MQPADTSDPQAPPRTVLVLDGHDGGGKTTLATRLAEAVGGIHVRPFAGSVGESLLRAGESADYDLASKIALDAVRNAYRVDPPVIVFDRHWMTVFTLVPEQYWDVWMPLPPTTLCVASYDATLARLRSRGEPGAGFGHRYYLNRYADIARRFSCNVVRTDDRPPDASLASLVSWGHEVIAQSTA